MDFRLAVEFGAFADARAPFAIVGSLQSCEAGVQGSIVRENGISQSEFELDVEMEGYKCSPGVMSSYPVATWGRHICGLQLGQLAAVSHCTIIRSVHSCQLCVLVLASSVYDFTKRRVLT